MKIFKTILMVAVVAGALVAIPASGQTSNSEGDSSNAALMALVESQQAVIDLQQDHIESLEALVDSQRTIIRSQQALLDADLSHLEGVTAAPAPMEPEPETPTRELTAEEMADAAIVCATWRVEVETTEFRRSRWVVFAAAIEDNVVTDDTLQATIPGITTDRDRITVAIPLLSSEGIIELMTAMEDALNGVLTAITEDESAESLVEKINATLAAFDALEAGFVDLCNAA